MPSQAIAESIPKQKQGGKTDTHHKVDYNDVAKAKEIFSLAKQRLADPNHWYQLTGKGTASFQLTDDHGNELARQAQVGDKIKINIPGPGTASGKGFDWVQIEKIDDRSAAESEVEQFIIQVRPTDNPDDTAEQIAHFFKNAATSSFAVERRGSQVITSVHGRNEVPNTESFGWLDKLRNFIIGLFASAGLSHPQWKALVVALQKKIAT